MKLLTVATLSAVICVMIFALSVADLRPSTGVASLAHKRELPLRHAVEAPTTQPRTRVIPIVD